MKQGKLAYHLTWPLILLGCLVCFACGCEVDQQPPDPVPKVRPENRFKVMLDHQIVSVDGEDWMITYTDISDIEIHSEEPPAADGFRTATISFQSQHEEQAIKAKVKFKYKEASARTKSGGKIALFPVEEFEALSVDKVGDW